MGISEIPNCLFCKSETETLEHICIECDNAKNLWKVIGDWVRMIYDAHFKILDIEMIFGENDNSPIKQLIIYFDCQRCNKGKTGKRMTLGDLKRCLQKNLNITRLHEILIRNEDTFDQLWNTFLIDLREDSNAGKSWYLL